MKKICMHLFVKLKIRRVIVEQHRTNTHTRIQMIVYTHRDTRTHKQNHKITHCDSNFYIMSFHFMCRYHLHYNLIEHCFLFKLIVMNFPSSNVYACIVNFVKEWKKISHTAWSHIDTMFLYTRKYPNYKAFLTCYNWTHEFLSFKRSV